MWAALKWGALVGAGIYLLDRLLLTWVATALFGAGVPGLDHPALFTSLCLGIFALLFAFSAAGYFAGRESAQARMGAVAGLLAFVIYAALSALYTPTGAPASPSPSPSPAAATTHVATVAQATATATAAAHATATAGAQALPPPNPAVLLAANVTSFMLVAGIAALMGWLGGRPGAQQSLRRRAVKRTAQE